MCELVAITEGRRHRRQGYLSGAGLGSAWLRAPREQPAEAYVSAAADGKVEPAFLAMKAAYIHLFPVCRAFRGDIGEAFGKKAARMLGELAAPLVERIPAECRIGSLIAARRAAGAEQAGCAWGPFRMPLGIPCELVSPWQPLVAPSPLVSPWHMQLRRSAHAVALGQDRLAEGKDASCPTLGGAFAPWGGWRWLGMESHIGSGDAQVRSFGGAEVGS